MPYENSDDKLIYLTFLQGHWDDDVLARGQTIVCCCHPVPRTFRFWCDFVKDKIHFPPVTVFFINLKMKWTKIHMVNVLIRSSIFFRLIAWLVCWSVDRMVGRSGIGQSVSWSVGQLVSKSVGQSVSWSVSQLVLNQTVGQSDSCWSASQFVYQPVGGQSVGGQTVRWSISQLDGQSDS